MVVGVNICDKSVLLRLCRFLNFFMVSFLLYALVTQNTEIMVHTVLGAPLKHGTFLQILMRWSKYMSIVWYLICS